MTLIRLLVFNCLLFLGFALSFKAQCGACEYQVELIQNGNFSQGNTGFTTSLNYVTGFFSCPLCPEGTYTIGANATLFHSGFTGTDHTNPPFGQFFIANAAGQSGSVVWCQSMSVQPGTTYQFSFWTRDVANNNNPHPLAQLQLQWNGVLQEDTIVASGGWQQYTTTWYSGNQTTLQLCIINQQWQTGGNDFGLDDISLTACHQYHPAHPAFAGNDTTICSGSSLQIGMPASNGYTYHWQGSPGLSDYNTSMPLVSNLNESNSVMELQYILTLDSAAVGCITRDTVVVHLLPLPQLDISGNALLCPAELTDLSVQPFWDNVLWSTGENTHSISVGVGAYSVVTQFGTCYTSGQVTVQQYNITPLSLGSDQEVCSSQLPLILDAGNEVLWNNGVVSNQIAVNAGGTYFIAYTLDNCSFQDTVNITVTQMPEVVLPFTLSLCEGETLTLESGISGEWNTGFIGTSIVVQEPGAYSIWVYDGPCVAMATTTVSLINKPNSNLPDSLEVCEDQIVVLDAFSPQNTSYLWSDGSMEPSIEVMEPGIYGVQVTNQCGSAYHEVTLTNYPCNWGLFIPNSFSPNNDGVNDAWMVKGFNISNLNVRVYNRLGDLIFYSEKMDDLWQPDLSVGQDVYNYRIEALDYYGRALRKLGYIYLLR